MPIIPHRIDLDRLEMFALGRKNRREIDEMCEDRGIAIGIPLCDGSRNSLAVAGAEDGVGNSQVSATGRDARRCTANRTENMRHYIRDPTPPEVDSRS